MVTKEVAAAVGGLKDLVPTGTSVLIEGVLTEAPAKAKQVRHLAEAAAWRSRDDTLAARGRP